MAIAVIRHGAPLWVRAFGVKSVGTGEQVTPDTIFEAASLSKPVFTYAVMKLVDEGALELDVPLSRYLDTPYLTDHRIDRITARHVLSHRTGFPNWRPRGRELAIKLTPGERFSYSGEGFVYLAKVAERITGMPFDAVMTKMVFGPLGMSSSSYVWRGDYERRTAVGHDTTSAAQEKGKPTEPNAAASLHTTAGDYAKFVAAVVSGAGLKTRTWQDMLKPQVAVDPECTNCTDRTPSERMSTEIFWGLGWGLERTKSGDAIWHWGDNGNFRCFVMAYPNAGSGVVMFTNSANGLLIAEDVVKLAIGGNHPVFSWMKYGTYDSADFLFAKALRSRTADEAIAEFGRSDAGTPTISEQTVNTAGYRLLAQKRTAEAITLFTWNVERHPKSANAYDSLGEAYMASGDKALAIKNYQRSLAIDPTNANAVEMLKRLKQ